MKISKRKYTLLLSISLTVTASLVGCSNGYVYYAVASEDNIYETIEPIKQRPESKPQKKETGCIEDIYATYDELPKNTFNFTTNPQTKNLNTNPYYSNINSQRLTALSQILKKASVFSDKDRFRDFTKKFQDVLSYSHNSWYLYAANIVENEKSNTYSALKQTQTQSLKQSWLGIIDARLATFLCQDKDQLIYKFSTFIDPNKNIRKLDSYVMTSNPYKASSRIDKLKSPAQYDLSQDALFRNKLISNGCQFYFKVPTSNNSKNNLVTLTGVYSVKKMFHEKDNDILFVELKMKTTNSVITLYLKSNKYDKRLIQAPRGYQLVHRSDEANAMAILYTTPSLARSTKGVYNIVSLAQWGTSLLSAPIRLPYKGIRDVWKKHKTKKRTN